MKENSELPLSSLQIELAKRNISVYYLVKTMGKKVRSTHSFWASKIAGTTPMTPEQLEAICKVVNKATPKQPLTPDVIGREVQFFYVR